MGIENDFVSYLRNSARRERAGRNIKCPVCETEVSSTLESFKAHVQEDLENHSSLGDDALIEQAFKSITLSSNNAAQQVNSPSRPSRKRPVSGTPNSPEATGESLPGNGTSDPADDSQRGSKKLRSPPASDVQQRGSSPPTPSHSSNKPKHNAKGFERAKGARNTTGRSLWDSDDPVQSRPSQQRMNPRARQSMQSSRANRVPQTQHQAQSDSNAGGYEESLSHLIKQPETKPICQEQLVTEVKGIYTGLVIVESKCIEVDNAESKNEAGHTLGNEQWQALVALHRTLLHEHHDFFLASQHPSASTALRRLASKYAMPARMWRHGIHSFLELLRHKLPASLEHMLNFIYLAYSMMALLYETVPAFEDTWIECLGDLGRYRMAIEDDDIRDREVWTGVSRYWYSKASDKAPTTGRLHHHLAILARPNALQQLYYYAKSLCVPIPFPSARESIMTLFDPVLNMNTTRLAAVDASFVRVHAIMFCQNQRTPENLASSQKEFFDLLDGHIARTTKRWLESGYFIGIALGCSLLEYGKETNVLMKVVAVSTKETGEEESEQEISVTMEFEQSLSFAVQTYEIIIRRWGDRNTFPFLHTVLAFVHHLAKFPTAIVHVQDKFPWKLTALMLNYLKSSCKYDLRQDSEDFPWPIKGKPRPLPEDHAMRGLVYTEDYFPNEWFTSSKIDEEEKYLELPSMAEDRRERILWLGRRIAAAGPWLVWDDAADEFTVAKEYDIEIDGIPTAPPEDDDILYMDIK